MVQQVKQAIRSLLKRPRYTLMVLLIMALCIGGNASVFSTAKAVLFQELPYENGERLVVFSLFYVPGSYTNSFSYPEYLDWRKRFTLFEELSAFIPYSNRLLKVGDGVERIGVNYVVPSYLQTLGIDPQLGRLFSDDEHGAPGSAAVVVISHELWSGIFGGDPAIIGRTVHLNDIPYTVVGVMPEGFFDLSENLWDVDAWLPAVMAGESFLNGVGIFEDGEARYWDGLAVLPPNVSVDQARQEAARILQQLRAEAPQVYKDFEFSLTPIRQFLYDDVHSGLQILLWGGLLVLVLGCANIANLLLARFAERKQEFSMHMALGASRWQLVRFSLLEAMLLALAGGALGLLLAAWGTRIIPSLVQLPPTATVKLDGVVLLVTVGMALLTGILFAIPAALGLARLGSQKSLREVQAATSSRSVASANRSGVQILQVAVVVILLLVAGLLLRSFQKLHSQEVGFDADRLLAMRVSFGGERFGERTRVPIVQQDLLEALGGVSGVEGAAFWAPGVPGLSAQYVEVTQEEAPEGAASFRASAHIISRGALGVLGVPLLQGREFTFEETPESPQAVILSKALSDSLWPGEDPLGKRLRRPDREGAPRPVVLGIIPNAKLQGRFTDSRNHIIFLSNQLPVPGEATLLVRTGVAGSGMTESIRQRIRQVDPSLPVYDISSIRSRLEEQEAPQRLNAAVVGLYSVMALIFALLGLYGMQAYAVIRRTREIGLRVALGASPADILRIIMTKAFFVVGVGLILGIGAALLIVRFLEGVLYGTDVRDPFVFLVVVGAFCLIAGAAAVLPSRRALRVEPIRALQVD